MDQLPANLDKWGVINTHTHKEALAIKNLQRQNFQTYCPLIRKRIKHARRQKDVLRPLFPSYVFVRINVTAHHWRSISSTFGVRSLMSYGERLSFLHGDFIDSLRAREVDGAIVRPENPYSIGQRVKILGGAFDGLIATIIEMSENDRLVLLMNLLNRSVKIKLNENSVADI